MDVGVIGCGMMGKNHIRVYSEMKSVDQIYVHDVNRESVAPILSKCDSVTFCPTVKDVLSQTEAVSICVPTQFHYFVAKEVFSHNVSALIEKPMCSTAQEAEELIRFIPKGLTVGVGHIERFNPIIDELTQIVKKPLYIEICRHNPGSSRIKGTSVVEDLMIHDIDLIFNLFPIRDWKFTCSGNDDVAAALFTMNGYPVILSASRKSSKKVRTIYIEEESFTADGDFMAQELYIHRKPGRFMLEGERYSQECTIEKVQVNKSEPLKKELRSFIGAVREGKPFPITPEQALFNLQVCERIQANLAR